jgi:5'-nucleotidase (lipoprotein e(P4) family)
VGLEHHRGGVRTRIGLTKVTLTAVLLAGCAGAPVTIPTTVPPEPHEELDSVLWVRTSPEYEAVCREVFALAEVRLDEALADTTWTASLEQPRGYGELPPAVILDVDETVLDNSAFEARLINEGKEYNEPMWDSWVVEEAAVAVPGATDFISLALDRGVEVFFVTNRNHDTEEHTVRNLQQHFGPSITGEQVLTQNELSDWTSDKTSRRDYVASAHRVLLLVGDDLSDFVYSGDIPQETRTDFAGRYSESLYGSGRDLERADKIKLKRESLDLPE